MPAVIREGQTAEITEAIRVLRAALGTPTTEPDDTQPCGATSNGTRCYKPAGHQTHRGTPGPGQTRWWTDATSTPANSQPAPTSANTGSWADAVTDGRLILDREPAFRLQSWSPNASRPDLTDSRRAGAVTSDDEPDSAGQ